MLRRGSRVSLAPITLREELEWVPIRVKEEPVKPLIRAGEEPVQLAISDSS